VRAAHKCLGVGLAHTFGDLLFAAVIAVPEDVLFEVVRLAGHCGLVGAELSGLEDEAVHRDSHAVLDVDNVANVEVVVVKELELAAAENIALKKNRLKRVQI
jgi:hypothetical protein